MTALTMAVLPLPAGSRHFGSAPFLSRSLTWSNLPMAAARFRALFSFDCSSSALASFFSWATAAAPVTVTAQQANKAATTIVRAHDMLVLLLIQPVSCFQSTQGAAAAAKRGD